MTYLLTDSEKVGMHYTAFIALSTDPEFTLHNAQCSVRLFSSRFLIAKVEFQNNQL